MPVMNATKGESPSMLRQRWLETAVGDLRKHFAKAGHTITDKLRVSIGWGYGAAEKIAGQSWPVIASSDKHYELFISPASKDGADILGTLAHELVHVVDNNKNGHKGPFKQIAESIGLEGKMTSTTNGPAMREFAEAFIKRHGEYPAGSLSKTKGRKVQGTRLIKCECETCGYIARTTAKWITAEGEPHCGVKSHGRMKSDYVPGEDEEGEGDE